ncbi:hypothetical protein ACH4Q7_22650 [Streptomyces roseolus]|uniref:hypothetical protein n=1 Tax=Streptomyces roseolus TaxID=67358 RepID=UPI0037B61589
MRTSKPTIREAHELGDAVGRIAGLAARSLHDSFPHLDADGLVLAFTSDAALRFIGRRYLAAIEEGKAPGEAAADAGTALIRAWAEARQEARDLLEQEATGGTPAAP